MDIIRILEQLKKLELRLQDLYAIYHKSLGAHPEVAGVFFELSLDEKSHADLIDYELRMVKKNRSMFRDVEFDIESLNGLISEIENRQSDAGNITPAAALKFALDVEGSIIEYYYKSLISESNPEVGLLVKKLGGSEQDHSGKLEAVARKHNL